MGVRDLRDELVAPAGPKHHASGIAEDLEAGSAELQAAENLRDDARLLKTLLLSAPVPEEESLRALTPARLAALQASQRRAARATDAPLRLKRGAAAGA